MNKIKKYDEFKTLNEKMLVKKYGEYYSSEKIRGIMGEVRIYFNESGILGANDTHLYWDEIFKIYESLSKQK